MYDALDKRAEGSQMLRLQLVTCALPPKLRESWVTGVSKTHMRTADDEKATCPMPYVSGLPPFGFL